VAQVEEEEAEVHLEVVEAEDVATGTGVDMADKVLDTVATDKVMPVMEPGMTDTMGEATGIMTITLNTLIPTTVATLTTMQRPVQLEEVVEGEEPVGDSVGKQEVRQGVNQGTCPTELIALQYYF